jgi:hypothetical protein
MIPQKLNDSRCPCRDYVGILIFIVKNSRIPQKLIDSSKNVDDFLVERNRANLWLHIHHIGINMVNFHEKQ